MDKVFKKKVIGIDIGISVTTIAVVDQRGRILATDSMSTADYPIVNGFIEALSDRIVMLAENNGGYESIRSVGICAPSANYLSGCIENASNIPWKGIIPMTAMLRDRIGLAVALANNAHVTALGEYVYGSAHGMDCFAVISLGHGGVGSCFYTKGIPHLGAKGSAGEIGHVCVEDGGRLCNCGRRGCLERYLSKHGIVQTAREFMDSSDKPSLMRDLQELSIQTICECCEKNDEMAIEVFRMSGLMFGVYLANYATVINPEAIILTEVSSLVGKWLMPPLEESFNEHVFPNIRGKVKLLISELDNHECDVLGASALAWTVKEYSLFK